ncbi:MAG TPA: HEPN domain-containing protein [bacterium]|nr:HEPN domain-containing protein [bacterium]
MRKEAKRWLKEAEFDIKAAKDNLKEGNFNIYLFY